MLKLSNRSVGKITNATLIRVFGFPRITKYAIPSAKETLYPLLVN